VLATMLATAACGGSSRPEVPTAVASAPAPVATPAAVAPTPPPPLSGLWTVLSRQALTNQLNALSARPQPDVLDLRVDANLAWRIEGVVMEGSDFWLFLDTDGDRRTGCDPNGFVAGTDAPRGLDVGADFMIAVGSNWGRTLFRCQSGRWVRDSPARVELHEADRWFEVAVPLERLGRPAAINIAAACMIGISGWQDQIPSRGHVTFAPQ
jgi:hypothetical protein